jgi:surface antigen
VSCVLRSPFVYSLCRAIRPIAVIVPLAGPTMLCGCAISTQLGPIFGSRAADPTTTASITPSDHRFSAIMTDEDWARAQAALATALDAEHGSGSVGWDNPASGLKGSVSAVAGPFPSEDGTCHAFVASVVETSAAHWYQGRACKGSSGQAWSVVESADWSRPGQG